ncbi:MAG: hypothetical protein WC243_00580 [Patescibacteria group bacterium]
MPPFLFTVILIALALWGGLVKYLFSTAPSGIGSIIIPLALLLFAVSFTLSIPMYFHLNKKSKNLLKHRQIFRKSLKIGFIIGIGITMFLALNAFELLTALNVALFTIPYLLILWQELKSQ